MKALLKISEPGRTAWEFSLPQGRDAAIGRSADNDIVLDDQRVSRHHAMIRSEGGGFKLLDGYFVDGRVVRSINRLLINGRPDYEHDLADGDVITIGESRIDVSISQPAAAIDEPDVNYADLPFGNTMIAVSANEIIGRHSGRALITAEASPDELKLLRRKALLLELLYEMSGLIGSTVDLEEVFDKATDLIFRGTPAERVVALLGKDLPDGSIDTSTLYQAAVKTRDPVSLDVSRETTVSRTITQKVITERVALLSQDARSDELFKSAHSIVSQGVRSTICAPLITESSIYGVVYADRLDPFSVFSNEDLELISALTAQAAVMLENVRNQGRLEREAVARANYGRFMPEYVVRQMLEHPESFKLGGATQTVTVLFADIRGFTAIAENEEPEKIVTLLNRYFTAMSEMIFSHGGTLDKYIGDGLMAIFGAPSATEQDAANAVRAAVEMQRRIASLNSSLTADRFPAVSIGIGLHTGEATIGYIGSDKRSEYTAIGDTVNLAARLESAAGGGEILISDATQIAAGADLTLTPRGPLHVKGRNQPVASFIVNWQ